MNELQLITEFKNDSNWLHENYDTVREEYGKNKYVAIKNKKVIADSKDHETLIKELKRKKINPALILIEFIYDKGIKVVL
jgi:hypothetical protein